MLTIKITKNSPKWLWDLHYENAINWVCFLIEQATDQAIDERLFGEFRIDDTLLFHPNCKLDIKYI